MLKQPHTSRLLPPTIIKSVRSRILFSGMHRGGLSVTSGSVVIKATEIGAKSTCNDGVYMVSCIARRKVGNAVKRNLVKRRLRALTRDFLKRDRSVPSDFCYLVMGSEETYRTPFQQLKRELYGAFAGIKRLIAVVNDANATHAKSQSDLMPRMVR